jgi:sugar lactone lactonase YvrE
LFESLEERRLLAVTLTWSGPGSALSLTEGTSGATPTVVVSEPVPGVNTLEINLGASYTFAAGSTTSATGLTYQNAGSPTSSQYATIDTSLADNIISLAVALPGDGLTLGPIQDPAGGLGGIIASAAAIEAAGINTTIVGGSVNLAATGNLTVDAGTTILAGSGTVSLAADVKADGTGDDGVGTLSINAGAVVSSANSAAYAVTLRGAAINIDTSTNPALVEADSAAALPALTLSGLSNPQAMALDASGDLYVANYTSNSVSIFAPGTTMPSATLTGLDGPAALAVDASGDVYVANATLNTVSKFAPGATTPIATLTGVVHPCAMACDSGGNLYVVNEGSVGTISKFAPGTTTPAATLTGLHDPDALVLDASGHVYVANYGYGIGSTVSEFAPGTTTPTATLAGVSGPDALALDSSGNLFVSNYGTGHGTTVSEFTFGATTPTATLVGLSSPDALACDASGDLYVANYGNGTVSKFVPGAGGSTALAGLSYPAALALDTSGNVYVLNIGSTVSESIAGRDIPAPGADVAIRSSLPTRPMNIGGSEDAVAGINLTDAELAQVHTTVGSAIIFGDDSQTGDITFTTATPATTPGASTVVVEAAAGPGAIILNDGGGAGTALNGNGGDICLSAGIGGLLAASSSNSDAEIATTGATVTINTTGLVGTAANPIQFADDANTSQQDVQIGSFDEPASVFLDGLGDLTLETIQGGIVNTPIDVTARGNLVVAAGATINSGDSVLSLAAGVNADGTGTLSIGAGATVASTNSTASAITLRGAEVNLDTGSNPAVVGESHALGMSPTVTLNASLAGPSIMAFDHNGDLYVVNATSATVCEFAPGATTPFATLTGVSIPVALAFDQSGDVYVAGSYGTVSEFAPGALAPFANISGLGYISALAVDASGDLYVASTNVYEYAPGATTPDCILAGFQQPAAMAFDASGDLYVADSYYNKVSKFAPGTTTPIATLSGLNGPDAMAFDASGDLFVANNSGNTVSEFAPGATAPFATLTGLSRPGTLAFDPGGDLYVLNGSGNTVSEFVPGAITPSGTLSGLTSPQALALDPNGNLYVASRSANTISKFTRGGAVPIAILSGSLNYPSVLAFDASGNLYVANGNGSTVSKFAPGAATPTTTLKGLTLPDALAFDASGDLYVANGSGNYVSKFAPDATTPTATLAGSLNDPDSVVVDSGGNVYVANGNGTTVSKFAPGATTPIATLSGVNRPTALLLDADGNLYAANAAGTTVSEFAPGATTPTATLTGLDLPWAMAFDAEGNLYVANLGNNTVSEFAPGVTTPIATLTGLNRPSALAFDRQGNLYVVSHGSNTVSKFTPGATAPTATFAGFGNPVALVTDSSGNLYVSNANNNAVIEVAPNGLPTAGGVVIRCSLPNQPMSIGGTTSTGTGINLTAAELAQIATTAGGTITFGDSSQAGNITFITATPATTPGASTAVVQSPSSPGQIILDDSGMETGLSGDGGAVSLSSGTGGIVAALYPVGTPLATLGFNATGLTLTPTLDFAPTFGTQLTLINNTASPPASNPIIGTFANLPQGGIISASYGGTTYRFQANYAGGDGNDLVLTVIPPTPTTTVLGTSQTSATYGTPITFTATVAAQSGEFSPTGSVEFFDSTTNQDLGPGTLDGSTGAVSLWTLTTGVKTFNVTAADTTTAVYTAGTGFGGSSGTTTQAITPRLLTVAAVANSKGYDGTTSASSLPTITAGSLVAADAAAFSETYGDAAVGTAKTLNPSGTVSDGDGGADYSVTFVANTGGVITPTVSQFVVNVLPSTVTAGNNLFLVVTPEDAAGNAVSSYAGTIQFTSSDPLELHPAASLTFTPGSGVAYAMATLETAGSWTITASDGNYTGTSAPVAVTAAAASKLIFDQEPLGASAGATIAGAGEQPVTVDVEDAYGNPASAYSGNVTLTISSGKLLGTTTVAASGGVATFNNLLIDQAGSYTLTASAAGVGATATSNVFTVTTGAAAKLAFTAQPVNTLGARALANVVVAVEDQYGNTVTSDNSGVTLSLNAAVSGGGGVLKGATTVTASGGVATFSGLAIVDPTNSAYSAAGSGYTLSASDGGLPSVKSAAFNTTLIVTSCMMTPTGFTATFSQPFKVATTPLTIGPNLYGAASSGDLPANVSLIGSEEGTVRGSLVLNSTDTQITFVATTLVKSSGLPIAGVSSPGAASGILAPDGYLVTLTSDSTSFVTTNGQLLDGTDSGSGGNTFNQFTAVNYSSDVQVVIPSFARGPSGGTITSTVNVPNAAASIFSTSPISIASSAKNGATESGGTVTIATTATHGLVAGQTVLISGLTGSYTGYNGTFTVTGVPSSTTFTYTDSTTGLGNSGGGTVTGYGLVESGTTVTVWTTASDGGLAVGEPVTISGAGVSGYNGTFTVTSLPGGSTGTTFTYTDSTASLANSGGGTAALARGIPISISGPTGGVTSGQFTLTYTASDLSVSGALVDPTLATSYGATLSLDSSSTPGNAIIDFKSTTPLPTADSTPILLGGLMATVPSTAYYKAKDLLHFSSLSLNTGVTVIGSDALHLVTFQGDGSGDGAITSADALDISRVVAGADAGFAAYPLTDPTIIADMLSDGVVDGPNGALLGRYINGIATPQLPVYPGAPVNKLSIADPMVGIPSVSQLGGGESATGPATVIGPSLADLTTSVVASPVAPASDASPASVAGVSSQQSTSATTATSSKVSPQLADELFAAVARGPVDADESAVLGSIAEPALCQGLTAQASEAASTQADLDRLLWDTGNSSWLAGGSQGLF